MISFAVLQFDLSDSSLPQCLGKDWGTQLDGAQVNGTRES